MIDPAAIYEQYHAQARSWSGTLPGKPTWGPHLSIIQAIEHERTLICSTPTAAAWDQAADRRQAAWDRCIFATGLAELCRTPHHAKPEYEEP